jgi:hypothetical protein
VQFAPRGKRQGVTARHQLARNLTANHAKAGNADIHN